MTAALSQLHANYGAAANASAYTSVGYPLGYQNNPVQIAWDAIMENHFIPFPVDFYTNKTVRTCLQAAAVLRIVPWWHMSAAGAAICSWSRKALLALAHRLLLAQRLA